MLWCYGTTLLGQHDWSHNYVKWWCKSLKLVKLSIVRINTYFTEATKPFWGPDSRLIMNVTLTLVLPIKAEQISYLNTQIAMTIRDQTSLNNLCVLQKYRNGMVVVSQGKYSSCHCVLYYPLNMPLVLYSIHTCGSDFTCNAVQGHHSLWNNIGCHLGDIQVPLSYQYLVKSFIPQKSSRKEWPWWYTCV